MKKGSVNPKIPVEQRLMDKVFHSPDGCWYWLGTTTRGYGMIYLRKDNGKTVIDYAHRVLFRFLVGEIPEGLFLCHHCDNPLCVNPGHLFLGTQRDNVMDAVKKGRIIPPKYISKGPTFDETEAYNKPDSAEVIYYKSVIEKLRKELYKQKAMKDSGEDTQRIDDILQLYLPDDYYEEIRHKLIWVVKKYKDDELASLREQLKLSKEIGIERGELLKQKEDENRELVDEIVRLKRAIELYKESLGIKDNLSA